MKTTTPKQLRSELKDYLDQASKEPIKIKRRSGKNYILISEERYMELTGIPLPLKNSSKLKIAKEKASIPAKNKTTKKKALTSNKKS